MQGRGVVTALIALVTASGCSLDRSPISQVDGRHQVSSIIAGQSGSSGSGESGSSAGGMGGLGGGPSTGCPATGCITTGQRSGRLPNGECEPTGVFGARFSVDVAWGGHDTPLGYVTDNGRGRIYVHFKIKIDQVGADGAFAAEITPCGTALPMFFSSPLCEAYQPEFPVELWDSPTMRVMHSTGSYDCTLPGCMMHLAPTTALIGIDMGDPEGSWPSATQTQTVACTGGAGASCFLDHDNDGHPGITIKSRTDGKTPANSACANGYPFRNPPLTTDLQMLAFGTAPRAENLYLGTRVRISGDAPISVGCGRRIGKGTARGFDSRAIACGVQAPAGQDCNPAEQQFMDSNLPVYTVLTEGQVPQAALDLPDKSVSEGTLFSVTRLGDSGSAFSCADVRNATY